MSDAKPVMAATAWSTNAALIANCARLGYLDSDWVTLDPTYGEGNWWNEWRPMMLYKADLHKHGDGVADFDYRAMPWDDEMFDAVTFDPPYVSVGGRETSTIKEMHRAYGIEASQKTPRLQFEYNTLGFAECVRVVKVGGFILYKSQDYITSGKFQPVTHWIIQDALDRDMEYVDRLEHYGSVRPQPPGRRQVHARRNLSTLLVFRKRRVSGSPESEKQ